jgi:hypothetical protein
MAALLLSLACAFLVLYISKFTLLPFLSRHPNQHPKPTSTGEKTWNVTKVKKYPHDLHDVCEVIFLLRQLVVPDLIPDIMALAEYWIVTSAARASRRAVFTQ